MTDLEKQLAKAEARVDRLKRQIAQGPCRDHGHTWAFIGGRNAECGNECSCSVPVYQCSKCGDCDYGQNEETEEKLRDCAAGYGDQL